MKRSRAQAARGFTLIVVVLLIAVLAVMGMSLLQLIGLDLALVGQSRRNAEARQTAEGALMEVINHLNLPAALPDIGTMTAGLPPPAGASLSPFSEGSGTNLGKEYTGQVNFLRYVPINESSISWTRAMVYEVEIEATYGQGRAQKELRAEIYRVASFQPGVVLPQAHYR